MLDIHMKAVDQRHRLAWLEKKKPERVLPKKAYMCMFLGSFGGLYFDGDLFFVRQQTAPLLSFWLDMYIDYP